MQNFYTILGSIAATLIFAATAFADPFSRQTASEVSLGRIGELTLTNTDDLPPWLNWDFSVPPQPSRSSVLTGVPSERSMAARKTLPRQTKSLSTLLLTKNDSGNFLPFADGIRGNDGDEPDIANPGPDMGDYPNSAFTLKKGRVQLEMAPASFRTQNANNSSAYATPFLFRYGVTDDVEFRVLGTGLTSLLSPDQVTGFGVLTFDTKIHLWNDQMDYLIPAVSFEATLQTQLGSPEFRAGTEPGLNINMDFPFSKKTNFEATIGYAGNLTDINLVTRSSGGSQLHGRIPSDVQIAENLYVASFQWALEQQVTDKFELFVHGYFSKTVRMSNSTGVVVGAGFMYKISNRTMLFGSANAGLTSVPSPFLSQLGLAVAF